MFCFKNMKKPNYLCSIWYLVNILFYPSKIKKKKQPSLYCFGTMNRMEHRNSPRYIGTNQIQKPRWKHTKTNCDESCLTRYENPLNQAVMSRVQPDPTRKSKQIPTETGYIQKPNIYTNPNKSCQVMTNQAWKQNK